MADNFDKSAILGSFLDEVHAYIPEIEAHLDQLQQVPDDETAIEEAYRRTHTIYGSAAMMEFSGLASIAQRMELELDDALERRTALDQPTIALLRRSCGRLLQVAQLIRSGGSDAQIVLEDRQDHEAYRGAGQSPIALTHDARMREPALAPETSAPGMAPPLPDWLAAFGPAGAALTPQIPDSDTLSSGAIGQGDSGGFPPAAPAAPADPWATSLSGMPTGYAPAAPAAPSPQDSGFGRSAHGGASDGLDAAGPSAPAPSWGQSQATAQYSAPGVFAQSLTPTNAPGSARDWAASRDTQPPQPPASTPVGALAALDELRSDEEDVRRQVVTLHDTVAMLRDAAQAMDNERIELQSFLDGSNDALERLEEWVGQQMGLDLRRSPETVRGYLPLSVIWVTTTRLKKLIALLNSSGRSLTLSKEQIDETLDQFRATLDTLSRMSNVFGSAGAGQAPSRSWAPSAPSASLPAVEPLAPGQRAELERSVREDLRRSLEDDVRRELAADIRREEEQRIRQELEVQFRRQMMFSALGPGMGESAVTVTSGGIEVRPHSRAVRQERVTDEQSPETMAVFREEALELLRTITIGIADLERSPGDMNTLQTVRRAMHTLKGAAGMMRFVVMQSLAHASEDLLVELAEHERALTPEELSLVFDTAETLDQLITGAISSQQQQREVAQAIIDRYGALTGAPVINLLAVDLAEETAESVAIDLGADTEDVRAPSTEDLSVRLKLSKVDELVNLFGDLVVNRSIFEERIARVYQLVADSTLASERLREVGSQLESQFETFMLPSGQSGMQPQGTTPAQGFRFPWNRTTANGAANGATNGAVPDHLRDFHELEMDRYTEFHRLSRILSEAVADVHSLDHEMETIIRDIQLSFAREARLSAEVQDRLLKARLVPVSSLVPRLYRAVRASALKEGKEVEFFVEGGETEVDRKVIEEVEGPLLHLVRNAVNHGIERPDIRQAEGKQRTGKITLSATYEGNQVVIDVRDDGVGIDPRRIRETAIAKGWVDAYSTLSDRDALNLIFQPGVSTAETLTEESGRGVGLDVVRDAASRLRGSVSVDSSLGAGSVFTLKFPISLQIARALLVKAGARTYAIPMAVADQIGRLDYYERVTEPAPAVIIRGERYTLARLSTYLNEPAASLEERTSLLVLHVGGRRVALAIDGILNQLEIVAKPLGAHLRDVRGVAGATTLGNGQVVIILDLLELLAHPIPESIALPIPGQRSEAPTLATRPAAPAAAPMSRPQAAAPYAPPAPPYAPPAPPYAPPAPPYAPPAPPYAPPAPPYAPPAPPYAPPGMPPMQAGPAAPAAPFNGAGALGSSGQWRYPPDAQVAPANGLDAFPTAALPNPPQRPPWEAVQPGAAPLPPLQQDAAPLPPLQPPERQTLSGQPTAASLGGQRDFVVAQRSVNSSGRIFDAPPDAKRSYLLVVDDSPSVRRVVGGMLKAHGWETQTARDGVEALDQIARARPAAVLLDIEMPRMDGYELMATLRSEEQYRNLPLIVLTSRAGPKHQQRATQLGANAYIVKPYQDDFLLTTIADLVRRAARGTL